MSARVYFVKCSKSGAIVSVPYWTRAAAREGLRRLRGDVDGRGPLKPHTRACLVVRQFCEVS